MAFTGQRPKREDCSDYGHVSDDHSSQLAVARQLVSNHYVIHNSGVIPPVKASSVVHS